jgi:cbb3-type cytochrome oxidase maturation protein
VAITIILICVSVAIAVGFLGVFFWSLKSGQYDDTYTPSVRMLFDDKPEKKEDDKKPAAGRVKPDKNQRPS